MNEETKEAFVDTMYTFDVVAMPGFKSSSQRVVDFETKKTIKDANVVSMFETAQNKGKKTRLKENQVSMQDFKKGQDVEVDLGGGTTAIMTLIEDAHTNTNMICAKAQLEDGEIYDICYSDAIGKWELDEEDPMELLTESINTKKKQNRIKESMKKVTSLKKLKEGKSVIMTKRLLEAEGSEAIQNEVTPVETDQEDLDLVQEAIEQGGNDNFEILSETEDSAIVKDPESGDVYVAEMTEAATELEMDIAKDLLPKVAAEKKKKGSFTVKDLEATMKKGGAKLNMIDKVMANLVSLGFDFDSELEESEDDLEAAAAAEAMAAEEARLTEARKGKKPVKKIFKLKESFSVVKAKRLFEAEDGGVEAMMPELEQTKPDAEDVQLVENAIAVGGDDNFEVLAENEDGSAMIQDVNTNEVYVTEAEADTEITPAPLMEALRKKKRLKESVVGKRIVSFRKLKESEEMADTMATFEAEGVEGVEGDLGENEIGSGESEMIAEAVQDGTLEVIAESEDGSVMIKDPSTEDVFVAEVEEPKTPLTESKRRVKSISKLKESKSKEKFGRLLESEGVEAVEDSFEPVETDAEDIELMEEDINGGGEIFEIINEEEDSVIVKDPETEDVYMVETEDVPVSPMLESIKNKKKLKEALRGKNIKGLRKFKENISKIQVRRLLESGDEEAIIDATVPVDMSQEEAADLKTSLQEADDMAVMCETDENVAVQDTTTGEEVLLQTVPMTESRKIVKSIKKFKESSNRIHTKTLRLFEAEGAEAVEPVLDEVETDEDDVQLMEEVINSDAPVMNLEVVEEADGSCVVEDKDNGDTFMVETEDIEVPVEDYTTDEKVKMMETTVGCMAGKLDETIDTVNNISEFCEEASEVVDGLENSTRSKTLEILSESRNTDLFAKKRIKILESAPEMKMYESDDEVLMAFDGLDEEDKPEIVEALGDLDRDELLETIKSCKA